MDYATREPFGFPIKDLQSGMLMSVIMNSQGAEPRTSPSDFMLGEKLAEGPPDEDGNPTDDALALRLAKLIPPRPKPEGE